MLNTKEKQRNSLNTKNINLEFEFYTYLSESTDPRNFKERVIKILNRFGLTDFSFVRVDNYRNCGKDAMLTLSEEQVHIYHEERFYEHDLILSYIDENLKSAFLLNIYEYAFNAPYTIDYFEKNKAIFDLNKRFGFFDHYCVIIKSCNKDCNVLLSVSIRGKNPFDLRMLVSPLKSTLELLAEAIDHITVNKFPDFYLNKNNEIGNIHISSKRIQIMTMLANDLSAKEIAYELNIKTNTVHQHVSAIKKILHVKTTPGAITKLIKSNLIPLELINQ